MTYLDIRSDYLARKDILQKPASSVPPRYFTKDNSANPTAQSNQGRKSVLKLQTRYQRLNKCESKKVEDKAGCNKKKGWQTFVVHKNTPNEIPGYIRQTCICIICIRNSVLYFYLADENVCCGGFYNI